MKSIMRWLRFKSPKKEIINTTNKIEFIIDSDGIPHVKVSVANTDMKSAEAFADLVHSLSIGAYNNSIIDTMDNMSKEDSTIQKFITSVLIYYNIYQTNHVLSDNRKISSDRPLIKPTEFIKKNL